MLTILSSLAQGESEGISTNTKWAVKKRFQDGSFILGCPAYGYTKDEAGELIIKDKEYMRHFQCALCFTKKVHQLETSLLF